MYKNICVYIYEYIYIYKYTFVCVNICRYIYIYTCMDYYRHTCSCWLKCFLWFFTVQQVLSTYTYEYTSMNQYRHSLTKVLSVTFEMDSSPIAQHIVFTYVTTHIYRCPLYLWVFPLFAYTSVPCVHTHTSLVEQHIVYTILRSLVVTHIHVCLSLLYIDIHTSLHIHICVPYIYMSVPLICIYMCPVCTHTYITCWTAYCFRKSSRSRLVFLSVFLASASASSVRVRICLMSFSSVRWCMSSLSVSFRSSCIKQNASLQHTATTCSTLKHAVAYCGTMQHTAVHFSTRFVSFRSSCITQNQLLQHTAAHCSTLQHTATHCSTLQRTWAHSRVVTLLLCHAKPVTATHCNKLQHTPAHSSTL